ncbi:MAG: hypothetical protein ACFCVK_06205 [Acidimicrobiales bacterium]
MPKPPLPPADDAAAWFAGRLPSDWFEGPVTVRHDKDEIVVIGRLTPPANLPESEGDVGVALAARIAGFREDTRQHRIRIADEAQARWQRIVSWGASCGDVEAMFTHAAVPVMTRLTFEHRTTLDTLIDAGVAGSRSEALAWCVAQVGEHQGEWIGRLRQAMTEVERIRAEGPEGA